MRKPYIWTERVYFQVRSYILSNDCYMINKGNVLK